MSAIGPHHAACANLRPDCLVCSSAWVGQVMPGETGPQGLPNAPWASWMGRAASATILRLAVFVYDELHTMLGAAAPDQILARGQGWSSIVSGDTSKRLTFGKN